MTGISDIPDKIGSVQQQTKTGTPKTGSADKDLFKQTFDKVMSDATGKPEEKQSLPPLGEIASTRFNPVISSGPGLDTQTDSLLSKLESYSQKLGNPDISLKEIEPLISDIKNQADELSKSIAQSGENAGLKKIADETALSANLEYVKFMRGDYV